jgi:AraC-like DNA-binding protein
VIESGMEVWYARGETRQAGPMDLLFNNPLDVHDGRPAEGGYCYRMTYPSVALMREIASEVAGRSVTTTPFFPNLVVEDRSTARLFLEAHRSMERGVDVLEGEELLIRAYVACLLRHGRIDGMALFAANPAIERVRDLIETRYAEHLDLGLLAAEAGLSRHHLIRAFSARIGLTPHAYLVDVRVRRARAAIRAGHALADIAATLGFADQAHFTRVFKARTSVTPGAYRKAVGA